MNRTRSLAFLWILVLFLLQNGICTVLPDLHLPLVLIAVIFYALFEGPAFGAVLGCYAGVYLDLFGFEGLGHQMLLFGVAGALSGFAASKIFRESFFSRIFLPPLIYYLLAFCHQVSWNFLNNEPVRPEILKEVWQSLDLLATAVFSPFVFGLLKNLSALGAQRTR